MMLRFALAVLVAAVHTNALAQPNLPYKEAHVEPSPLIGSDGKVILTYRESQAMATEAWQNAHPDYKYLLIGRKRLFGGDYKGALWNLDRSAYFGDKLAQAMLAEMHWEGKGTPVDRVRAYALADVAAERLNEPFFISLRERYWNALIPSERERVNLIAEEILARYSDNVTSKKLEQHWRHTHTRMHAKGYGRMIKHMVVYNHENGSEDDDILPSAFHAYKFYDTKQYREFKDNFTAATVRTGTVKVRMGNKSQSSRVSTADPSPLDQLPVHDEQEDQRDQRPSDD